MAEVLRAWVAKAVGDPQVSVSVYGSTASGFCLHSSDLNLAFQAHTDVSGAEAVARVAEVAAAEGAAATALPDAAMPVAFVTEPATGLRCTVAPQSAPALRNTALLAAYASADPRVRGVAIIVKHWCGSNDTRCRASSPALTPPPLVTPVRAGRDSGAWTCPESTRCLRTL